MLRNRDPLAQEHTDIAMSKILQLREKHGSQPATVKSTTGSVAAKGNRYKQILLGGRHLSNSRGNTRCENAWKSLDFVPDNHGELAARPLSIEPTGLYHGHVQQRGRPGPEPAYEEIRAHDRQAPMEKK